MKKDELNDNIESDVNKMRGALLEMISNNRSLNSDLVDQMNSSDFNLIEEYNLLSKSILEAVKALTDIHSQTPKILKGIQEVPENKPKIDLKKLMDDTDD